MTDDLVKAAREALAGLPMDPSPNSNLEDDFKARARFFRAATKLLPAMAERIAALEAEVARLQAASVVIVRQETYTTSDSNVETVGVTVHYLPTDTFTLGPTVPEALRRLADLMEVERGEWDAWIEWGWGDPKGPTGEAALDAIAEIEEQPEPVRYVWLVEDDETLETCDSKEAAEHLQKEWQEITPHLPVTITRFAEAPE